MARFFYVKLQCGFRKLRSCLKFPNQNTTKRQKM